MIYNTIFTCFFGHKFLFICSMVMILAMMVIYVVPGSHQKYVADFEYELKIMIWWVGLGVLSSIGLGTGLHTFVLYLGPWIAQVTLAGTECKSLNFDTYGPNRFLCPDNIPKDSVGPSYGDIMVMVWFEAFLWGAGTALGELPPYFVAKQASKSGKKLREITGEEEDVGKLAIILSWFKNRGAMGKFFSHLMFCISSKSSFRSSWSHIWLLNVAISIIFYPYSYWKRNNQSQYSSSFYYSRV